MEEIKGEEMTIARIIELNKLDPYIHAYKLRDLPTHEKLIWFRNMIDKNMVNVTQGANEITVDRDNLLADAMG